MFKKQNEYRTLLLVTVLIAILSFSSLSANEPLTGIIVDGDIADNQLNTTTLDVENEATINGDLNIGGDIRFIPPRQAALNCRWVETKDYSGQAFCSEDEWVLSGGGESGGRSFTVISSVKIEVNNIQGWNCSVHRYINDSDYASNGCWLTQALCCKK